MQSSPSPHGLLSEYWLPALTMLVGSAITYLTAWLTRKKPSEVDAANHRTRAEARKTEAEALVLLSTNIAEINIEMESLRERHAADTEALRKRVHNAADEINRCYAFIKHHEIKMTVAKIEFEPFNIRSYKDIMGE